MSKYSKPSILREKSMDFAVLIIELADALSENRKNYRLADQIIRSGTSIGANIREAGSAESSADFVHKLGIAQKECDETIYWLELLKQSERISEQVSIDYSAKASELLVMIKSSILTAKGRRPSVSRETR